MSNNDRDVFESSIKALEAEIANAGAHLTIDTAARQTYARQIHAMAEELRSQAQSGKISWKHAAEQAQETRNIIMKTIRVNSTPVGRALAEKMKSVGRSFNEMIAKKTIDLYGPHANFNRFSSIEQNAVYIEIVKSAGKAEPGLTQTMRRLSPAARGLVVFSLALSVYTVMTAEDKVNAARREVMVTSAGIGGGIAGGALAGLACGPAAPVCVTVGAFAGGALAAFGIDFFL